MMSIPPSPCPILRLRFGCSGGKQCGYKLLDKMGFDVHRITHFIQRLMFHVVVLLVKVRASKIWKLAQAHGN